MKFAVLAEMKPDLQNILHGALTNLSGQGMMCTGTKKTLI